MVIIINQDDVGKNDNLPFSNIFQHMDPSYLYHQWLNGIKIAEIAHRRAATFYKRSGRMLGIPVTIFTVLIGTSVFSTLGSSESRTILLFVGIVSVCAAVLSGLQTFLNYPELAEKHNTAGVKYGKLRRHAEEVIAMTNGKNTLTSEMKKIRLEWDKLEDESPLIPQRFHDKALRFVKPEVADKRGIQE